MYSLASPRARLFPPRKLSLASFTSTLSSPPNSGDYDASSSLSSPSDDSTLPSLNNCLPVHPDQAILESGYFSQLSGNPEPPQSAGTISTEFFINALPDLFPLLSNLKAVTFDFCLRIDRIRVSWKEADWHKLDQYQLRAYLLLDEHDVEADSGSNAAAAAEAVADAVTETTEDAKKRHAFTRKRKQDQKPLATLSATRTLTLSTTGDTEICFDDCSIPFRTKIPVEQKRPGSSSATTTTSDRQFIFRSRVVRLKLERLKHGAAVSGSHHPIGFVDLDLAQLRQSCLHPPSTSFAAGDGFLTLPMVLFTDYNRHIGRHQTSGHHSPLGAQFTFDIRLKLDSTPLDSIELPLNLDAWISAESLITSSASPVVHSAQPNQYLAPAASSMLLPSSTSSQSLYLSQLLLRQDSLPNLSQDRELKYHESPHTSRATHLLNLFGILPPGQLFRVSIHFGQIDDLDSMLDTAADPSNPLHCVPKRMPTSSSIYACFEVKHHKHQPTIFHHHHQRSSICCRTRQLTSEHLDLLGRKMAATEEEGTAASFDQHFTFFERYREGDSPSTVLSVRSGTTGKKLFAYKCHLAEYVHCRSVNQYFTLPGRKPGQVARLQFSIAVKPVQEEK